jgi:hypothetical protein
MEAMECPQQFPPKVHKYLDDEKIVFQSVLVMEAVPMDSSIHGNEKQGGGYGDG